MGIEVWWGSGSGPAWRVLMALVVKQIPYTSHLISFSERQTRTPEFLALNPRGKVPVLREGDFVLNESLAILAYLDAKHPERPLLGTTAEHTGRVWRAIFEYENHLNAAAGAVVRPILFGDVNARADEIKAAVPALRAELDILEQQLSSDFLTGDTVTAADLVVFAGVAFMVRGLTRPAAQPLELGLMPLAASWPRVQAWAARVEALPGIAETVPPHWREGNAPWAGVS